MISIPLAHGEVFDKLTILEIKELRLESQAARGRVGAELQRYHYKLDEQLAGWDKNAELAPLLADLRDINGRLWQLENTARTRLAMQGTSEDFAKTAAEIFARNEQRASVKRRINLLLESSLCEEKEYSSSAASSLGIDVEQPPADLRQ